jgi:hypothetical protein
MDTSIARRSDGKLIRAAQGIDKSLPFNCPGCKQEVYAATEGKIQRPHFRHKSLDGLKGCSEPESYIHWVTKELFADNYEKVTSFYISLEILKTCIHAKYSSCQKTEQVKIDLKKIYPYIQVEEKEGSFRPDCLLFNDKGEKLFFEVCYSSRVSEDKIKSGIPIIELYTVNEQTIDSVIRDGKLNLSKEIRSYYGRPIQQLPQTKVYNEGKLLLHVDKSFDCVEKCIVDLEQKKYQRQRSHSSSRDTTQSKPISLKSPTPEPVSKIAPFIDPDAIAYLSHYKQGYYAREVAIPSVLGKCKQYYTDQHKKYKNKKIAAGDPVILDMQSVKFFISYQKKFFGVIRYEAYWHIFYYEDDKLIFISSMKNKDNILNEIKTFLDVF